MVEWSNDIGAVAMVGWPMEGGGGGWMDEKTDVGLERGKVEQSHACANKGLHTGKMTFCCMDGPVEWELKQ